MERCLTEVAEDMLHIQLTQDKENEARLRDEILVCDNFFLIGSGDTTEEEWTRGKYEPYISERGQLILFLSEEEALQFAKRHDALLYGQPMVTSGSKSKVSSAIARCRNLERIETVRIYAIPPLFIDVKSSEFRSAVNDSLSDENYKGIYVLEIDKLEKALNTFDKSERRKLDPALRCENVHQMYSDLISSNRIDPEEVDRALNFQVGFTQRFCTDIVSMETSKEALKKLLDYFGLGSYLYIYKQYCKELIEELKRNPVVDNYTLKQARITTKEPFTLEEMCRGQDELNGAYVYGLTLKSEHRRIRVVISNPFGCVIGKSYDVVGLTPILNGGESKNEAEAQPDLPDALKEEVLKDAVEKQAKTIVPSKPGTRLKGTPEEIQTRQNYLIGYFKKRDGINLQAAEQKYKVLVEDPDVLEAFYLYVKDKQWGYLARHGYTPRCLIQELHYPPYEAYCIMIQLQSDTERTITMLKHRANEPQYQKGANKE